MGKVRSIFKYAGALVIEFGEGKDIIFREETLFEITRTLIGAFAALLALVGMFAVYRMQTIQNEVTQLELLKNERLFQKKITTDELRSLEKNKTYMEQFKPKGTKQKIEEIQGTIIEELELDYGKILPESKTDSFIFVSKEIFLEFASQVKQLKSKIEEINRNLDNIDLTIEKIESRISKKKRKILQIKEETRQMMMKVLALLVFCLPILPLSSLRINGDLLEDSISIFFVPLIISLSILVLLSIYRTLKKII